MIRKLQVKFVAFNMSIVTVMLYIIFSLGCNFTSLIMEKESVSMMRAIAADPFQQGVLSESQKQIPRPYFLIQINKKGDMIATGGYYGFSDEDFLRELVDKSLRNKRETGLIEEFNLRFYKAENPRGTVFVFVDISSEKNVLHHMTRALFTVIAFSFLVFLFISIFMSKLAVKPLTEAWQQQKQFVADASHELKTPLTVIMTNADLLQSGEFDEQERLRFSKSIMLMSMQMKKLVENMLELARSDAGQPAQAMQTVDFSRLIQNTELSFEGVFVEKGLSLESSVEPGISVHGNEHALQQLADILLDNAQKYSSQGGTTKVSLYSAAHGKCRFSVSNPGEEISQDELKNIFRRFYRLDKARSRDGSFGLGLSIAENIVTQHKGKIWAESKNGVNTFIVELKKDM